MMRTLAKHLLGKRVAGEIGYYKRLKYVEDKLKEIAITIAFFLLIIVCTVCILKQSPSTGDVIYTPDYIDENGVLHDTDGDGDYYHEEIR